MRGWILMVYKVPNEPSASRVYVWRKLKRLGALLLHDAAWVLPATPKTREQMRWLAAEVSEMGGAASVWECRPGLERQEDELVARFNSAVETEYQTILSSLRADDADLANLARSYREAAAKDYFGSPLGGQVREALLWARGRHGS